MNRGGKQLHTQTFASESHQQQQQEPCWTGSHHLLITVSDRTYFTLRTVDFIYMFTRPPLFLSCFPLSPLHPFPIFFTSNSLVSIAIYVQGTEQPRDDQTSSDQLSQRLVNPRTPEKCESAFAIFFLSGD